MTNLFIFANDDKTSIGRKVNSFSDIFGALVEFNKRNFKTTWISFESLEFRSLVKLNVNQYFNDIEYRNYYDLKLKNILEGNLKITLQLESKNYDRLHLINYKNFSIDLIEEKINHFLEMSEIDKDFTIQNVKLTNEDLVSFSFKYEDIESKKVTLTSAVNNVLHKNPLEVIQF